jgi:hypothetical protein
MMKRIVWRAWNAMLLSIAVSACGGGGGGGAAPPAVPAYSQGSRLFYTGSLHYFDSNYSVSPAQLDAGAVTAPRTVFSSDLSLVPEQLIYISGGRFWRVNARHLVITTPSQVSSEAGLADSLRIGYGLSVNDHQLLYAFRGADNTCGTLDDAWRWVSVAAASTDAPSDISGLTPIARYRYGANPSRWLAVTNAGELKITDVNFANPSAPLATGADPAAFVAAAYPESNGIYLRIGSALRKFDVTNGTLSPTLHTLGPINSITANFPALDNNNLYFVDGLSIYRIAHSTTSLSVQMAQESGGGSIDPELFVTTNRVVYKRQDGTATPNSVRSIARTANWSVNPVVPTTLVPASANTLTIRATDRANVFIQEESTTGFAALIRSETGALSVDATNAFWLGALHARVGSTLEDIRATHVLRATGMTGKSAAGATVVGVHAETLATQTLGVLDSDMRLPRFVQGLGSYGMLLSVETTPNNATDMYFADPTVANSLQRLTSSPSISESPVF